MTKIRSTHKNLQVIYEDNHVIVVNKRAGDIVQGDKTGDTPLSEIVKQYLKTKYNKPGNVFLGVVHRLDRPTTGIVLFAKTSKALPRLNKMFAEKKTQKTYWALVKNPPPKNQDRLTHWLKKNPKNNRSTAYHKETTGSKKAILNYKVLKTLDSYSLLEIDLETGRHHQIRSQLAAIGSPIKGDLKYGFPRSNPDASISLHARQLELEHPVKKESIKFVADVPNDPLWQASLDV
ncbi:RluA family pseudouridine synthase [Winogradskyella aurantiaca]|uniref:RluA family pseudouridine synthase n=1 Tax=Winogradskyella aurantiaca TaxID=2219558 RepID=UPI000E1CB008|nr:RluA family pseudouridine synthase [Winogradskyella aurantiaca]